jgi:hypothetical protein
VVRIDSRGGICVEQSAARRSSLDPITGTYQEEVKTSCRQPAELRKQVRVFRECDQKIGLAPAGAARQSARALR